LVIIFLSASLAAFVWLGIYDVAASGSHWGITVWIIEKVRDRSIAVRSKAIPTPPLDDPKLVAEGFGHYHALCRLCHSAPCYSQVEIAKGLNPEPPDLVSDEEVKWRGDAQLYWVIKNGIKMTGMPAFGPTHSEYELWGIVAFIKRLPNLKAEEYNAMVKAAIFPEGGDISHHHRPGKNQ
jgi:mono/diheme cytochrome c family protein